MQAMGIASLSFTEPTRLLRVRLAVWAALNQANSNRELTRTFEWTTCFQKERCRTGQLRTTIQIYKHVNISLHVTFAQRRKR